MNATNKITIESFYDQVRSRIKQQLPSAVNAFAVYHISLRILSVGVASNESHQVASLPDQKFLHIGRGNDLPFHHTVGQCFSKIVNIDFVADLQLFDISKHGRPTVSTVGSQYSIGIFSTNRI